MLKSFALKMMIENPNKKFDFLIANFVDDQLKETIYANNNLAQ